MVFPKRLFQIKEEIFESELIGHLCQLAGVQKLRTSPYHPQTNGQCERFQWHTPKHAGNINTRAEKGLEKSCPCSGTCLQLHQEYSHWV